MKLLVGLGNPGKEYELTRHNVGSMALEYCMEQWLTDARYEQSSRKKSRLYQSWEYRYYPRDDAWIDMSILFPHTYMNLSGSAVKNFLHTHGDEIDLASSVWVFHDDIDLPFGAFKIDRNVSSGGHKGVQDIIEHLKTQDFVRFRIGIQPPQARKIPTDAFVLKKFGKNELEILQSSVFPAINDALEIAFVHSIERAQNVYNKRARNKKQKT